MNNSTGLQFLIDLRESRGWTKSEVAHKLGILPQTYDYYETRGIGLRFDILTAIKRLYRLSWQEIGKLLEKEAKRLGRLQVP